MRLQQPQSFLGRQSHAVAGFIQEWSMCCSFGYYSSRSASAASLPRAESKRQCTFPGGAWERVWMNTQFSLPRARIRDVRPSYKTIPIPAVPRDLNENASDREDRPDNLAGRSSRRRLRAGQFRAMRLTPSSRAAGQQYVEFPQIDARPGNPHRKYERQAGPFASIVRPSPRHNRTGRYRKLCRGRRSAAPRRPD